MQIIFLVALGLLIISVATVGINRNDDSYQRESAAAAAHMSVYHTAAVTMCKTVACGTGVVNPTAYMNNLIRTGPLFSRGYFQTNYDAPSKTLVTYMKAGYALRGSVNFGTVNAALRDLQGEHSTSFGKWDRAAGRVVPSYMSGWAVTYQPPAGIRSILPDGAPVIVGRL